MASVPNKPLAANGLSLPILAILTLVAVVTPRPANSAPPLNTSFGVAIGGYDSVAYFTEGQAVKGSPEFAHEWLGATWHFSSAEHQEQFAANPTGYAPQFGGHCSRGMFKGKTVKADPEAWRIVDGKLYLFFSKDARAAWEQDPPEKIPTANSNWDRVKGSSN